MSATDLLQRFTEIVFLFIGLATLLDWARWRDRPRFDIALVFVTFALLILQGAAERYFGDAPPWMTPVSLIVLLAHPYLLMRVAGHFQRIPRWVHWAALAGLAFSTIGGLAYQPDLPLPVTLGVVIYFGGIEGYAAVLFVSGALGASGVPRRRLTLAAVGAGFLAAIILLAGVAVAMPAIGPAVGVITQSGAIVSGVCFFLGFAPPRPLRRAWQLSELYRFLEQIRERPAPENANRLLTDLCQAATRATGGAGAVLAMWDEERQELRLRDPSTPAAEHDARPLGGPNLVRVWNERREAFGTAAVRLGAEVTRLAREAGADSTYVVPIATANRPRWGLLISFRSGSSPFADDDLQLLSLLAEQSAAALDYVGLISEQARLIEQMRLQTAQLETANQELQTFSYSVSHDLRAPLRSIDGFSQVLLEDYGEHLDAAAQGYLGRVRANAAHMSDLIDDLLQLSKVTRAQLRHEPVDLGALAQSIAADLQRTQPDRQVELVIADGLTAHGDARLLRLALENLIGNAWKFTGKKSQARIEVGLHQANGQPTFFVRDNGAGFDMAYADKLFIAFQRLHRSADFPGTGIGLATAHRILQRHGGSIYAEAQEGQGATFHFTLP